MPNSDVNNYMKIIFLKIIYYFATYYFQEKISTKRMSSNSMPQRVLQELKKTTVEPFLFLVMFGYNVKLTSLQSLFHERACRVSLGFNHTVCDDLEAEHNDDVQSYALKYGNNLNNGLVMISTIPALIIATFLGE